MKTCTLFIRNGLNIIHVSRNPGIADKPDALRSMNLSPDIIALCIKSMQCDRNILIVSDKSAKKWENFTIQGQQDEGNNSYYELSDDFGSEL